MSAFRSLGSRALTALMKLAKWSPPPVPPGPGLELGAEVGLPVGVAGDRQDALGAVEDVADLAPCSSLVEQAADLELELAVVELEGDELRVGGLAVVGVAEPAAGGHDGLGELVLAQAPAGDVHLVDALVAEVAVAVVPDPVPVVVEPVGVERPLGRGAEPEVVVDARRAPGRRPCGRSSRGACSRAPWPCRPCRACPSGGTRSRPGCPCGCGTGSRSGRSGCTSARPRPSAGLR